MCGQAEVYASWAVYVFIGYEQAILPREPDTFGWIARYMPTRWIRAVSPRAPVTSVPQ